jgi:hypothetical protein
MKKTIMAVCITCALSIAAFADDDGKKSENGKSHEVTPEQKAIRKALIEKYDTNKDGKLDKEERAKISDADKAKMKEARGAGQKQEGKDKEAAK